MIKFREPDQVNALPLDSDASRKANPLSHFHFITATYSTGCAGYQINLLLPDEIQRCNLGESPDSKEALRRFLKEVNVIL